jgi:hypothetical protein
MVVVITDVFPGRYGSGSMIETTIVPPEEIPTNGFRLVEKYEIDPAVLQLPKEVVVQIKAIEQLVAFGTLDASHDTKEEALDAILAELIRQIDQWRQLFIDQETLMLRPNWTENLLNSTTPLKRVISLNMNLRAGTIKLLYRALHKLFANKDNFEIAFSPELFQ